MAAIGGPLRIVIGSHDPMAAIQDALNDHEFGEVFLATRPNRLARWARLDLTSKVRAMGGAADRRPRRPRAAGGRLTPGAPRPAAGARGAASTEQAD